MTKLMSLAKGRFKGKKRRSSLRTMARKTRKRSKRSSGRSSGAFSGKILGLKIPIIGDALRNPTVQKVIAGAGIVSIVTSVALLLNNPTVNRVIGNPIVKVGLAASAGDVVGGVTQIVQQGGVGQLRGIVNGRRAQPSLVSVAGGGVA